MFQMYECGLGTEISVGSVFVEGLDIITLIYKNITVLDDLIFSLDENRGEHFKKERH